MSPIIGKKNRLNETKKILFTFKKDVEEDDLPSNTDKPKFEKRLFQHYWTEEFPWLQQGHTDTCRPFCRYCKQTFPLKRYAFLKHQLSTKHLQKAEIYRNLHLNKMDANSSEVGLPEVNNDPDSNNTNIDKMLRDKMKEQFSWLEEDPTDFSYAFCNLCFHKLPFKRHSFIRHEMSKKHLQAFQSNNQHAEEKNDDADYSQDYNETQDPSDVPELKTPPIECTSKKRKLNQSVKGLQANRSEPSVSLTSEIPKSASDKEYKYSYCIIKSNSQILGLAAPTPTRVDEVDLSDEELFKMVTNVGTRFSVDIKKLLKRDQQLRNYMCQNKDLSKGSRGIVRLKKILVGHLAQYYLSESTIELWSHGTSRSHEHSVLNAKLEDIQLQMERSIQELEELKAQIKEKEKINS